MIPSSLMTPFSEGLLGSSVLLPLVAFEEFEVFEVFEGLLVPPLPPFEPLPLLFEPPLVPPLLDPLFDPPLSVESVSSV